MNSNKKIARIAGLLYLLLIVGGIFAEFFVRQKIIVWGNAADTAHNIMHSEELFRLGFVGDLIMATTFFFLPLVLYILLKQVNRHMARIMVLSVMIAVSVICLNLLNQFAALILLNNPDYMGVFETAQLQGLVMFFIDMHGHGYFIAQIFAGLWLFPLGYLVFKSGFFPQILGIFLMIGCFSLMIDSFIFFLFPDYWPVINPIIGIPGDLAEFSFCLWLLVKGAREQKPAAREVSYAGNK